MSEAILSVTAVGPQVSVQDDGRPQLMRYGIPASGPMDRLSFAAANAALGNPAGTPGIEISQGGLTLDCQCGIISFAITGGGFSIEHAGRKHGSWAVATLRAGEKLVIRPGTWGSWCYLAFAGNLQAVHWLGSAATHAISGFGGGVLAVGQTLVIDDAEQRQRYVGAIPFPHMARPRPKVRVTLGPQERFFDDRMVATFTSTEWRMTSAWDRMGVRLRGPAVKPAARLDMPSEPVLRGSVQIAGDGVPTILLADHPTTGGYPKIATVLDCDLDRVMQLRPGNYLTFNPVAASDAVRLARNAALNKSTYLKAISS